jgi:hypothetical protein
MNFRDFGDWRGLLSEEQVRDLIDMFYRWDDSNFVIVGKDRKKGRRGSHRYFSMGNQHIITLSRPTIERGFREKQRMGGNFPAPTLELAPLMVLTHELQHANQAKIHAGTEEFFNKRGYNKRPCEREAREFVDKNLDVLADYLGLELPRRHLQEVAMGNQDQELQDVAELFEECEEVAVADIVEELRQSGINNPKNVEQVSRILFERGIRVTT